MTKYERVGVPRNRRTVQIIVMVASFLAILYLQPMRPGPRLLTESDLPFEEPIGQPRPSRMILGIFTAENDEEKMRRQKIRETYLGTDDKRFCKLSEYIRQFEESKGTDIVCRIPYVFVKGYLASRPYDHDDDAPLTIDPATALRPLVGEDDIIYLNIAENENRGKSTSYLKWATTISEQYKIDYIAKSKTTTLIQTDLFMEMLNKDLPPAPYSRRIYGGSTWGSFEDSNIYADGSFYFMSSDLAYYVSHELTPQMRKDIPKSVPPQEDVDMSAFVYSIGKPVKFFHLSQNQFWFHPVQSEEDWERGWKRMEELPTRGPNLPVHGICQAFEEKQYFEVPQ